MLLILHHVYVGFGSLKKKMYHLDLKKKENVNFRTKINSINWMMTYCYIMTKNKKWGFREIKWKRGKKSEEYYINTGEKA